MGILILFFVGVMVLSVLNKKYETKKHINKVLDKYKNNLNLLENRIEEIDSDKSEEFKSWCRPYIYNCRKKITKTKNKNIFFSNADLIEKVKNDIKETTDFILSKKRILENTNYYINDSTKKKRGFYYTHKKSCTTLKRLIDEYGEVVDKYIISFNESYEHYKCGNISKFNEWLNKTIVSYNNMDFENIEKNLYITKEIEQELNVDLTEPIRLECKFEASKSTIETLESEIMPVLHSLYSTTLNTLRDCRINKEQTSKWNSIKKRINKFRKDRILKTDIIKQAETLNILVKDLKDLNICIIDSQLVLG